MRIIIDGYNLLFAGDLVSDTPRGLEEARQGLIDWLVQYNRKRKHQISVVFDAAGSERPEAFQKPDQSAALAELFPGKIAGIKTVFAPSNKDADTFITEYVIDDTRQSDILVVSSDRTIRNALRATKAKLVKADEFLKELGIKGKRGSQKKPDPPEPPEKTLGISKNEVVGWLKVFGFEEE